MALGCGVGAITHCHPWSRLATTTTLTAGARLAHQHQLELPPRFASDERPTSYRRTVSELD